MRTPITYYGGKQQLADKIISMIPQHRIYVEPYFGGGAVFFRKYKSYLEVINDKNDRLITFYRQVATNFEELEEKINNSLCSESDYYKAKNYYNGRVPASDADIAWAVFVLTNGSFCGNMHGGWKWSNCSSGSHTGVFMRNKRNEFNESLKNRLQDVQISCRDAIEVIKQRDTKETFFYLDPPYPGCTQGHYNGYTHKDLSDLLIALANIKGKFILSNFWCQTLRYHVTINGWTVKKIDMPLKVANLTKAKRKTEILVSNFSVDYNLFQ